MVALSRTGLQLALLSLSGGYKDVALAIPQGSLLPPFLRSSSILHSGWPTMTSLFPHLLGNASALSAPPSFPNCSGSRMTESIFLAGSSSPQVHSSPLCATCRPRAPSGLSADFIGHADLCAALSASPGSLPRQADTQCFPSLRSASRGSDSKLPQTFSPSLAGFTEWGQSCGLRELAKETGESTPLGQLLRF